MWIWDRVTSLERDLLVVHRHRREDMRAISKLKLDRDAQRREIKRLKHDVSLMVNAYNSMLKVPDATCNVCGREMMAMEVMKVEGTNEYRCVECGLLSKGQGGTT